MHLPYSTAWPWTAGLANDNLSRVCWSALQLLIVLLASDTTRTALSLSADDSNALTWWVTWLLLASQVPAKPAEGC
jgi:hypothetical protein